MQAIAATSDSDGTGHEVGPEGLSRLLKLNFNGIRYAKWFLKFARWVVMVEASPESFLPGEPFIKLGGEREWVD
jgi:hypothetical protein